jgi:hypothetical protein
MNKETLEIESDNLDDVREILIYEESTTYCQIIEDLTGSDLSLLFPWLSIPTLRCMIFDIAADMDYETIRQTIMTVKGIDPPSDNVHKIEQTIRQIEHMREHMIELILRNNNNAL